MMCTRNGVLPEKVFLRNLWTEVACARPHIAMRQLEPCTREGIGEFVGVLEEAPGDLFVDGIESQGKIRSQHRRSVALCRIVGVRNTICACVTFGFPLLCTAGTLRQFPLV